MSSIHVNLDTAHPEQAAAVEAVPEREGLVRVYVWDLVVRATHWLIALSIVLLAITGYYLGNPFLDTTGEAGRHFTTGTVKVLHFYGGIVFALAVIARLGWMVMGHRWARWREFLPVERERFRGVLQTLRFYSGLSKEPAPGAGHNPLAGLSYLAVYALYLVMIATGLGLLAVDAGVTSYFRWFRPLVELFGGPQLSRWIHHATMWLLLIFVVQHLMSALLTSVSEKNGTMDSIFSGFKWLTRDDVEREKRRWTK